MRNQVSKILLQDLPSESIAVIRRHNLLKPLLRAQIIENYVIEISIGGEESDRVWDNYLIKNQIDDETSLNKHLGTIGLDKQSLRWQLELPLRITKYCLNRYKNKSEARFLSKKEKLDKVVYSLLRVKDGFLARELYLRIASQEANFADLAAEFSQGDESKTKGIVGPVPMNQAHPALSEKLRTSRPGQLNEPFNIGEWWLTTRLERYEPARFDESTMQAMTREMFLEDVEEEVVCKILEI
tara:strand:+ start:75 stop:797 length:723 start_codon:yes stop_codon:yes gene_type:complete